MPVENAILEALIPDSGGLEITHLNEYQVTNSKKDAELNALENPAFAR